MTPESVLHQFTATWEQKGMVHNKEEINYKQIINIQGWLLDTRGKPNGFGREISCTGDTRSIGEHEDIWEIAHLRGKTKAWADITYNIK